MSLKNVWIIICFCFVISSCVDQIAKKDFNKSIEDFNNFYDSEEDDDKQFLIYSDESNDYENCKKANITTRNSTLKELVILLEKLYDVNINYSTQGSDSLKQNPKTISIEKSDTPASAPAPVEELKVNLSMKSVCLEEVFEVLIEEFGVGIIKSNNGYTLLPKQVRTETFVVNYHNFYRKGNSSISIANSNLKDNAEKDNYSSITTASEEKFWDSISKTIRSILKQDKERVLSGEESDKSVEDFYVYKENGIIVVNAYPKQLHYIRKFLSQVNVNSTQQVLIEAKVLEVELIDEFNNGIQWDLLKSNLRYTSFAGPGNTLDTLSNVHKSLQSSTQDLISGSISGKVSNRSGFNAVMQALAAQGKVSVISSPRVLALNNQRALIKSGEDRFFVTNVTNVTANNSTTNNATSQSGFDLEPFFSGVALDTTPRILNDRDVLLHIHPMISRVENEDINIIIDNKNTNIPGAKIQSREADTVLRAKTGDIIILGGMTQNYVELKKTGLPLQARGGLSKLLDFVSSKQNLSKKVELIILIKPTILNGNENLDKIGTYKI